MSMINTNINTQNNKIIEILSSKDFDPKNDYISTDMSVTKGYLVGKGKSEKSVSLFRLFAEKISFAIKAITGQFSKEKVAQTVYLALVDYNGEGLDPTKRALFYNNLKALEARFKNTTGGKLKGLYCKIVEDRYRIEKEKETKKSLAIAESERQAINCRQENTNNINGTPENRLLAANFLNNISPYSNKSRTE